MIHNEPDITRFSSEFTCPVCKGHPDDPRRNGSRCFGFLSGDGVFAHCTREELAGALEENENSSTYPHLLVGTCRCGTRHGEPSTNGHKKIVATYDYTDPRGNLLHQTVRYEPKEFSQRRPDGNGGWIWSIKDIDPVLYRLQDVYRAILAGEKIRICEGEKDADRGALELGITTTTCAMGAKKWRDSYTQVLRGADVELLPHNDKAGREHVLSVAKQLRGVANTVKVVELPGVPPDGGDLSDWIEAGGSREALDELPGTTDSVHTVVPGSSLESFGAYRIADCEDPRPREYLIENFAETGHATYLYGGAGTMKSLIGTLACISVASPEVTSFCGLPVKKHGPAVIFDSELNLDELVRRTRQLCAGLDIVVPRGLYYKSAVGQPADETFPSLLGLCQYVEAVMTSIDSLGFAVRGSAEDYDDMKHALHDHIDPLRNAGTAPFIIDHKPHQGDNLFGSVAKTFHGRYIFLTEDLDSELHTPGKRNVRVTNKKESFGPKGRKIHLRFSFTPKDGPISINVVGSPDIPDSYEDLSPEARVQRTLIAGDKTKKELAVATSIHLNTLGSLLPAMREKGMIGHAGKSGREIVYTVSVKEDNSHDELPRTTEGIGAVVPGSSLEEENSIHPRPLFL